MLLFGLNLSVPTARAQFNLFEVFVTATNPSLTPDLTVGGSSLPDLIRNLVNLQAELRIRRSGHHLGQVDMPDRIAVEPAIFVERPANWAYGVST